MFWPDMERAGTDPRSWPSAHGIKCIAATVAARAPWGAVVAVAMVVAFHVMASAYFSKPVARDDVRRKAAGLSQSVRPSILIMGDSRPLCGIVPAGLASGLGVSTDQVANLSAKSCDYISIELAWREFSNRFAERPVVLISVSIPSANEGTRVVPSDELLWSTPLANRSRLAPASRVFTSMFLPERTLFQRLTGFPRPANVSLEDQGFTGYPEDRVMDLTAAHVERRMLAMNRLWYEAVNLNGPRWQQLESSLAWMATTSAQVVVVALPLHPAWKDAQHCERARTVEQQYRDKLAGLCGRLGVPFLSYGSEVFIGEDPNRLFVDLAHLNLRGARILTDRLAADLRNIIQVDRLR